MRSVKLILILVLIFILSQNCIRNGFLVSEKYFHGYTSKKQFANKYLMEPLGIRLAGWEQGPQGYYFGGNTPIRMSGEVLGIISQYILPAIDQN